ncbi:MAG: hypothetical protein JWO58_911 [Chitinophagaceae bacterium]|nr:hypothetical protein [Chitinophagaceae bacterium]
MNPKYDIYEEIDRYLNEELSEAELVQFNQKLSSDAEFKSIVDAQKIANEVIIDQEMIKLKERMNRDMNQDNNGSSHWGKIILFSAVVTSATLYTYLNYNKSDSSDTKENVSPVSSAQTITEGDRSQKDATTSSTEQPVTKASSEKPVNTSADGTPIAQQKIVETTPSNEQVILNKETIPTAVVQENKVQETKTIVPVEHIATVNCATVAITANIKVDYGFNSDGEATIIINPSSIKGGTAPYQYALDHSAFDAANRFTGMKDGIYHVRIKDHNNCVSEVKKEIVVKNPAKEIDEAFTPSHGERWKFPVKENTDATLTIFNKSGGTVYSAHISGGYPSEWNGTSNSGVELESGNYYFVIQYSPQDVVKGHISIVR